MFLDYDQRAVHGGQRPEPVFRFENKVLKVAAEVEDIHRVERDDSVNACWLKHADGVLDRFGQATPLARISATPSASRSTCALVL